MDGPFQLFNSLRRISVGQRIGDTFQFFHGPGIPYLFFPAFAAGGRTFFAGELSRQLISVVFFLVTTLVACRAWTGSWRVGVPLAFIASVVMVEFRLDSVIYPLNSLLGVRSSMPVLVGAHLLMRPPGRRADIERGLLLGLTLLLGTEQGMAALAGLFLARAAMSVRNGDWREQAVRFAIEAAGAVALYLVVVAVLAGSHTLSVLRFNFREVPQDQLWYFGAPPNPFLWRWSQIPQILAVRPRWWITIAAAIAITVHAIWRSNRALDRRRPMADAFMVFYGLISLTSMLGMTIPAYVQPATRVCVLVVLGWLYSVWSERQTQLIRTPAMRRVMPVIVTVMLIVISFSREGPAMMGLVRSPSHVARVHLIDGVGPAMSEAWVQTQVTGLSETERLRQTLGHTPVIWSTYAGLLEWQVGVFHPATDYIIHTLGPRRRAEYAALFVADHPDLVQTIRPSFTWYEEWLEGTHWDFYRPLLERYDVAATGPWSFFWTRRDSTAAPLPPLLEMAVPPNTLTISASPQLPADSVGVFEVRLRYRTHNPLAALPVLGGLPRYLIDLPGSTNLYPVSLAPYATERRFPVVVRGQSPIIIRGYVASLIGGATLTLDSVRIQRIPISRANGLWLLDFVDRTGALGR